MVCVKFLDSKEREVKILRLQYEDKKNETQTFHSSGRIVRWMGRKQDRQFLGFSSSLISCDLVSLRAHSEHPYPWWDPVLYAGGGVPID